MNRLKFIISLLILFSVLNCSRITQKVQQKVDEKIDKTIEENLNKLDSTMSKEKLDSLQRQLDSLKTFGDTATIKKKHKKNP